MNPGARRATRAHPDAAPRDRASYSPPCIRRSDAPKAPRVGRSIPADAKVGHAAGPASADADGAVTPAPAADGQ
jgi:hypothetical protein